MRACIKGVNTRKMAVLTPTTPWFGSKHLYATRINSLYGWAKAVRLKFDVT